MIVADAGLTELILSIVSCEQPIILMVVSALQLWNISVIRADADIFQPEISSVFKPLQP